MDAQSEAQRLGVDKCVIQQLRLVPAWSREHARSEQTGPMEPSGQGSIGSESYPGPVGVLATDTEAR